MGSLRRSYPRNLGADPGGGDATLARNSRLYPLVVGQDFALGEAITGDQGSVWG